MDETTSKGFDIAFTYSGRNEIGKEFTNVSVRQSLPRSRWQCKEGKVQLRNNHTCQSSNPRERLQVVRVTNFLGVASLEGGV